MSIAKTLTEEQISTIRNWAENSEELSSIQKRLSEEFGLKVTYLETRFLLEDLKIEIKPLPVPEPEEVEEPEEIGEESADEAGLTGDDSVHVTVDTVLRPGALISGRANFAGGNSAAWWLDQMGRLGMDPADPAFRPNEAQMLAFQKALQQTIQESGL